MSDKLKCMQEQRKKKKRSKSSRDRDRKNQTQVTASIIVINHVVIRACSMTHSEDCSCVQKRCS